MTRLRIVSGADSFTATVDPKTNAWTVDLPDDDDAAVTAAMLRDVAAEAVAGAGYDPDPPNRYARAIVRAFPGSVIVSGVIRSAPIRPRRGLKF